LAPRVVPPEHRGYRARRGAAAVGPARASRTRAQGLGCSPLTERHRMPTLDDVYKELRQVYDPEIPVNIVDLGLVYDVQLDEGGVCNVKMTLTSQSCPEARTIPEVMKRRVNALPGITGTQIEIVWEPAWGPHKLHADA